MINLILLALYTNKFYEKDVSSLFFKDTSTLILCSKNHLVEMDIHKGTKRYLPDFDFNLIKAQ